MSKSHARLHKLSHFPHSEYILLKIKVFFLIHKFIVNEKAMHLYKSIGVLVNQGKILNDPNVLRSLLIRHKKVQTYQSQEHSNHIAGPSLSICWASYRLFVRYNLKIDL